MSTLKLPRAIQHIHKIWKELSSTEGWKPWPGGAPPVGRNDEVGIKFRNSNIQPQYVKAEGLDWKHWGSGGDIVAYKIIKKSRKK